MSLRDCTSLKDNICTTPFSCIILKLIVIMFFFQCLQGCGRWCPRDMTQKGVGHAVGAAEIADLLLLALSPCFAFTLVGGQQH